LIGVLSLETHQPEYFNPQVIFEFLKLLATRIAVAIDNAHLYHVSQSQLTELEARNRELDAYSHTIAHDLKAPLNLAVFYASALLDLDGEDLPTRTRNI